MPLARSSLLLALAASCARGFAVPRSAHQARRIAAVADLLPAYDYVLVGGGTSALTVADRLTEDAGATVLVLEAGPFADPAAYLPVAGGGPLLHGGRPAQPLYNLTSAPQAGLGGRAYPVILGNMVGGSSGVNSMMNLRGSAEDYDRWGALFGDQDELGWNWAGMLPYFKKALNFSPPPREVAERFNITWDASYWGSESALHAAWPVSGSRAPFLLVPACLQGVGPILRDVSCFVTDNKTNRRSSIQASVSYAAIHQSGMITCTNRLPPSRSPSSGI